MATHLRRAALAAALLLLAAGGELSAYNGRTALAFPVAGIRVDGDLSDWPEMPLRYSLPFWEDGDRLTGPDDFSAEFRAGYSEEENALYLGLEAHDSSVVPAPADRHAWNTQDGCEVYLAFGPGAPFRYPLQYQMWGMRPGTFAGRGSTEDMLAAVDWRQDGSVFEWRIDLTRASQGHLRAVPGESVAFDVAFWDRDEDGTASWLTWGRGVGKYEDREKLGELIFAPAGAGVAEVLELTGGTFERRVGRVVGEGEVSRGYNMFVSGALVAFAALHVLLFLFDRKSRGNLYYALFTGSVAASILTGFQMRVEGGVDPYLASVVRTAAIDVIGLFGLRFLYASFRPEGPPSRFWAVLVSPTVLACTVLFLDLRGAPVAGSRELLDVLLQLVAVVGVVETFLIIAAAVLRRRDGAWIVGLGFSAFFIGAWQVVARAEVDVQALYWVLVPLVSVSIYLARTMARTNRDLEGQLARVRELSEERQQTNDELQRKTAQLEKANAELERKTHQLERANREVILANHAKSAFLANMSHEIRTPMNAVINFAALIEEGVYGEISEDMRDAVAEISGNGEHLLRLINDILDLSKIEAGAMQLQLVECAPSSCIESCVAALDYKAREKGLEVVVECDDDLPPIRADERRLTQHVLLNLVKNAIQFTAQGQIRVGARRAAQEEGGGIMFWVADTGVGIPEEEHERIFESFHQVDSSEARRAEGTGLGLAIARRFVEMHGGRIWVDSRLGEGATFWVRLPLDAGSPRDEAEGRGGAAPRVARQDEGR